MATVLAKRIIRFSHLSLCSEHSAFLMQTHKHFNTFHFHKVGAVKVVNGATLDSLHECIYIVCKTAKRIWLILCRQKFLAMLYNANELLSLHRINTG